MPVSAKSHRGREARERDEAVAGLAAGATYAGEADPYVKPREADEDE